MKICIFSRPFYPAIGGLEEIAKILALQFTQAGHSVEVVTDTPSEKEQEAVFPFRVTRTAEVAARWHAFRRSDVVLFMNVSLPAMPLALLSRSVVVLSHHGIYRATGGVKIGFTEFLKRQVTRFFANIAVSEFVARNLPGKSVVVPNAYAAELFSCEIPERVRDFVFCGRLVSDKGVDVLIEAFSQVVAGHPDATLTIIGDGPERPRLEAMVESLQLASNVEFTGTLRGQYLVKNMQRHLCSVIPSLCDEAFGISALEGIAACDVVLASNRGGLPEAVGKCGILVDPTTQSFGRAMLDVLKSREDGGRLFGQPSQDARVAHLRAHLPSGVAGRYLEVFAAMQGA